MVPVKGHASGISFGRIVHYPELTGNEFHTQELCIRLIRAEILEEALKGPWNEPIRNNVIGKETLTQGV